eukprot:TRINITY_DN3513_c0_g1_i2.p1 TRINITY_DN3513_c0_g1~~TRINITY_DN3513_c0_g1_i2.p1  ORF type:complete len:242 (-),score=27.79 TRINITY_DN3513_c0_g1_i2:153-878(-)
MNFLSGSIFSTNVTTKRIGTTLSVDAADVYAINYDAVRESLIIQSVFYSNQGDGYVCISEVSTNDFSTYMFVNLTEVGLNNITTPALDYVNGRYYMLVDNYFGFFDFSNTSHVYQYEVNCPDQITPDYVAYDYTADQVIGVGSRVTKGGNWAFYFLSYSLNKTGVTCKASQLHFEREDMPTAYSFDPVNEVLYMAYSNNMIVVYYVTSNTFHKLAIEGSLSDIEVLYTPPTSKKTKSVNII